MTICVECGAEMTDEELSDWRGTAEWYAALDKRLGREEDPVEPECQVCVDSTPPIVEQPV